MPTTELPPRSPHLATLGTMLVRSDEHLIDALSHTIIKHPCTLIDHLKCRSIAAPNRTSLAQLDLDDAWLR
ncbi:hypothetical protein [Piscinibacter terrae]|uniref:hypothetical protein n=1 Tax=Piscinibacter terrae TaxID=2496871 RepID=UPI000F596C1A|nr:hypothetical protein [Albitalea terrae]